MLYVFVSSNINLASPPSFCFCLSLFYIPELSYSVDLLKYLGHPAREGRNRPLKPKAFPSMEPTLPCCSGLNSISYVWCKWRNSVKSCRRRGKELFYIKGWPAPWPGPGTHYIAFFCYFIVFFILPSFRELIYIYKDCIKSNQLNMLEVCL